MREWGCLQPWRPRWPVTARRQAPLRKKCSFSLLVPRRPGLGFRKINRGRLRYRLLIFNRKGRLGLIPEHHRGEVAWKGPYCNVVFLHCFYVALTRDRDAIFSTLKLSLEIAKISVGFELRIIFGDDQQA